MHRRRLSSALVISLLLLSLLGASGCRRNTLEGESSSVTGSQSVVPTSAVATSSATATSTVPSDGSTTGSGSMSPAQISELERELKSIEKELEGIEMPSDSDFKDIEGDL